MKPLFALLVLVRSACAQETDLGLPPEVGADFYLYDQVLGLFYVAALVGLVALVVYVVPLQRKAVNRLEGAISKRDDAQDEAMSRVDHSIKLQVEGLEVSKEVRDSVKHSLEVRENLLAEQRKTNQLLQQLPDTSSRQSNSEQSRSSRPTSISRLRGSRETPTLSCSCQWAGGLGRLPGEARSEDQVAMAYDPQLDPWETAEYDIILVISKKPHVRLLLTCQAAYWPGKKTLAVSDPIRTVKVASDHITEIYAGRKSRRGRIFGGSAMMLIGLAWTFANYPEAFCVGYPQALFVGGIGVAAFGGRRLVLCVESADHNIKWVTPIAFGSNVKRESTEMFTTLGIGCKRHGIKVRVGNEKRNRSEQVAGPIDEERGLTLWHMTHRCLSGAFLIIGQLIVTS